MSRPESRPGSFINPKPVDNHHFLQPIEWHQVLLYIEKQLNTYDCLIKHLHSNFNTPQCDY